MMEPKNTEKDNKESGSPNQKAGHRLKVPKALTNFKGKTPGMNGNVFQVMGESGIKNQFKESLEALERYTGETYPREVALLQPLFKRLETPKLEQPKAPTNPTKKTVKVEGTLGSQDTKGSKDTTGAEEQVDKWEQVIFTERVKMYLHQEERLKSVMIALYNVTWGQCSRTMKDQLEAHQDFSKIAKADDVVGLLKLVKVLSHQFAVNRSLEESLDDAILRMMTYQQGDEDTVADHIKT